MNYQCPTLSEYAQLWLSFRDAELRAEIIKHREDCPVCIALKEATIERRKLQRTANIHNEISIQFPEQTSAELQGVLRSLYRIVAIRPGDIGWVCERADTGGGWSSGSIRITDTVGDMAGETAGG